MAEAQARVLSRDMSQGEEIYKRIQGRMQKLGLSEYAIKQAVGTDLVRSVRTGLAKGTQIGVSSRTLNRLAPVLHTTPEWLLTGEGVEDIGIARQTPLVDPDATPAPAAHIAFQPGEASTVEPSDVGVPLLRSFPRNVPVMGTAAGSVIRRVEGFALDREIVDYVRRPPALANRQDVYALYISGLSMEPMHTHGDLRFIDPRTRPQIGDSVIVVTRTHDDDPGQAYIKILSRRVRGAVVLKQLNPEAMIEIPERFILQMHRVMSMNDLFGV